MAITIQQYPTTPNVSNTALILEVTSNQISQPQFQYVVDIKDYNGDLIQRIKQEPNPSGKGVFNLSQIINTQFDGNYTFVTSSNDTQTGNDIATARPTFMVLNGGMLKSANVYVGEEYGTSVTSTTVLYDGNGNVGDPAVVFSPYPQNYLGGVIDWNTWEPTINASSNTQYTNTFPNIFEGKWNQDIPWGNRIYSSSVLFDYDSALTNFPVTKSVHPNDYYTLSFLIGSDQKASDIEEWEYTRLQWIYSGKIYFYSPDDTELSTRSIGGVRGIFDDTSGEYWYKAQHSQSLDYRLAHNGIGPQNISNYFTNIVSPEDDPVNYTSYYDVEYYGYKDMMANTYLASPYTGSNASAGEVGTSWLSIGQYGALILMANTQTDITGSYPSSTASITVRGSVGPAVNVNFTQSDALLFGGYPIATPKQIVNDINAECDASGSSVRAFYSYWPDDPNMFGASWATETPDSSKYNIVLLDYTPTSIPNSTNLTVSNNGVDPFGYPIVGENSALGLTIGDFTYTDDGNDPGEGDVLSTYGKYRFVIDWDARKCAYTPKQFAWKNEYGVFDYYTFTLAESTTNNINRNQYTKTVIDYNTVDNAVEHNVQDYGRKQFSNVVDQVFTVESDWIDSEYASLVKEMFYSTNVFLINPDTRQMEPVVIINTSIEEKTNPRTQKLYKLTAEYKYANNLRERV